MRLPHILNAVVSTLVTLLGSVSEVSALQCSNMPSRIVVKHSGSRTEVSPRQEPKILRPRLVKDSGSVTDVSPVSLKARSPIVVRLLGNMMEVRALHPANAEGSRDVRVLGRLREVRAALHIENADALILVKLLGSSIELKSQQCLNMSLGIVTKESGSVTEVSRLQCSKIPVPRPYLAAFGMLMEVRCVH